MLTWASQAGSAEHPQLFSRACGVQHWLPRQLGCCRSRRGLTNSAVCMKEPGKLATDLTFTSDVSSAFAAGATMSTEPTASTKSDAQVTACTPAAALRAAGYNRRACSLRCDTARAHSCHAAG